MPRLAAAILSYIGTHLKTFFTIAARARYASAMLLLAAAVIAASPSQPAPTSGVSVQTTATIRVISGVQVSFDRKKSEGDVPAPRITVIHTADAQQQPAKLIEFQ
jgi:hypothetical protein